jgi:uncharacterized protein YbjT (DUF2867 family)
MSKAACIAGATGVVGSKLVELLEGNSKINTVLCLNRREVQYPHQKTTNKIVDLGNLDESDVDTTLDIGFCCLGTTMKKAGSKDAFKKVDYTYVVNYVKWCIDKGISTVAVVSAMGADATSSIFYNRVKGEMEEHISELCSKAGVRLIIAQPSIIMEENRGEFRLGEKIGIYVMKVLNPLFVGPLKKYRGIKPSAIAGFMLNAALNKNKEGVFTSDQLQSGQ